MDERFDSQYRQRFQQFLPFLLKQCRSVSVGEPLKYTESVKLRRLFFYCWWVRMLWVLAALMFVAGCFLARFYEGDTGFLVCMCACFPAIFALAFNQDYYIPSRWGVFHHGLLLRSSRDRRVFFPWASIRGFETKHCFPLSRIVVHSDFGTEWIQAEKEHLLPFLTKLLDLLPGDFDRSSLLKLKRKLLFETIHNSLFREKESWIAMSLMLCIPVVMGLNILFPANNIGIAPWLAMMGGVFGAAFGFYLIVRNGIKQRHERSINTLLDELESTDRNTLLVADQSVRPQFGEPPRTVSDKAKRSLLFFAGEAGGLSPVLCGIICIMAVVLAVILGVTDKSEIRYGFLPFRWVEAGEGQIVSIADSSTETAPNGNPCPPGRDVITLEQTLPDGQTVRCRNPGWPPSGRFQVGQTVPLLRYSNDPACLMIDHSRERFEMWFGFGVALFFASISIGSVVLTTYYSFSNRRRIVRLLETAMVARFRINRKAKRGKTLLQPLEKTLEPITMSFSSRRHGETVEVFIDETKPSQSFVVESAWCRLVFDPATAQIDSVSDWPFRLGVILLASFAVGLGVVILQISLVY